MNPEDPKPDTTEKIVVGASCLVVAVQAAIWLALAILAVTAMIKFVAG